MADSAGDTGKRTGPARTLTSKTVDGLFWSGIGSGTFVTCQLAIVAILARMLTPAEFGVVTAAGTIIGLSNIFVNLGVGPAIVQHRELTDEVIATGTSMSLIMGCAIGALIAATSPVLAGFYGIAGLQPVLATLALLFPISAAGLVASSLLQRDMRFRRVTLRNLTSYVVGYGGVSITLALLGFGVWALVFGQLAQTTMQTMQTIAIAGRRLSFGWSREAMHGLLRYGVGSTLARIGNYTANQADYMVVGRVLGPAALGFYGRSYQFVALPSNLFGTVTDRVLFPAMAAVQHDRTRLERAYRQSLGVLAMVTLPLSGLLFAAAPEVVAVLLGERWMSVVAPFRVLTISLLFRTSYKISDSLSRASAATMNRAWRQWLYALAVIGGAIIGTRWNIMGVAVGVSIAIVLNFLLMLDLGRKLTGIRVATLIDIYARHAAIAALTTWVAVMVLVAARHAGLIDITRLALAGVAAGATWLAIARLVPRLVGDELDWLLSVIGAQLERRRNARLAVGREG
ncbi:MAG TPA: lipopolysaccharide biosynthesis protein [Sphingomonas sp.]|nr:lipopolysaccharide biosynthesis protein [Sphingomonas sp.]